MGFFPRGPGPLVSIMIPTRGRPEHLLAAIDSAVSLAVDSSRLEFLLKIDDDDAPTIQTADRLMASFPSLKIRVVVSPRGRGYHEMHEWINQLAAQADGDWVFLFNDDARFKTPEWDALLTVMGTKNAWVGIGDVCLLVAPTIGRPMTQEFFFLRRKVVHLLGHLSLSPHNDNWIYTVMKFCGCTMQCPIEIEHLSDVIADEIRDSTVEAYRTTSRTIESIEARRQMWLDANTLLCHLEKMERKIPWTREQPTTPAPYFFRPDDDRAEIAFVDMDGKYHRLQTNENNVGVPKPVEAMPPGQWAPFFSCLGE